MRVLQRHSRGLSLKCITTHIQRFDFLSTCHGNSQQIQLWQNSCLHRNQAQSQVCSTCGVEGPSKRALVVHRLGMHLTTSSIWISTDTSVKGTSKRKNCKISATPTARDVLQGKRQHSAANLRCRICLQSFLNRRELFQHQVRVHQHPVTARVCPIPYHGHFQMVHQIKLPKK